MEPVELRPLSLGELLDRTFTLYRGHFWLFTGIMAIPSSFSIPLSVLFISLQGTSLPSLATGRTSPAFPAGFIALVIAFGILLLFVQALAIGATTYAVSETYLGHEATVRGSYGKVRGNFWKIIGVALNVALRCIGLLIFPVVGFGLVAFGAVALATVLAPNMSRTASTGVTIVIGLIIFLGYLVVLVWFIFLTMRYAVSIPALLIEKLMVLPAIRRSVYLTQGRRWHIFLAFLLAMVLAYVGVIVFQGPFLAANLFYLRTGQVPAWLTLCSAAAGAIGGTITGPLLMIVLVLCYYDSRIRKEAFDLQFMMSSLDAPAAAPGAATPA